MRCSSGAQETTGRSAGRTAGGATSAAARAVSFCGGASVVATAAVLMGCAFGAVANVLAAGLAGADVVCCGFGAVASVLLAGLAGVRAVRGVAFLAAMAFVAAAMEAGVGWRRIGARGASV